MIRVRTKGPRLFGAFYFYKIGLSALVGIFGMSKIRLLDLHEHEGKEVVIRGKEFIDAQVIEV